MSKLVTGVFTSKLVSWWWKIFDSYKFFVKQVLFIKECIANA